MLIDTERAAELLDRRVVPEHLFMSEIINAGLDQDPEFRASIAAKRQELMVTGLRKLMVDQQLSVTPEEARTFYDEHPEKFTKPTTTVVIEILVSSDSLAQHLFTELAQATEAEAETLAVRHSERAEILHHNGRISLNIYTEQFFPRRLRLGSRPRGRPSGWPNPYPARLFGIQSRGSPTRTHPLH